MEKFNSAPKAANENIKPMEKERWEHVCALLEGAASKLPELLEEARSSANDGRAQIEVLIGASRVYLSMKKYFEPNLASEVQN